MKRLLLIFVIILNNLTTNAQTSPKNWNVGIDLGGVYSHLTTTKLKYQGNDLGFTGGVTGVYNFRNNITTELGVRLVSKGSTKLTGFDAPISEYLQEMTLFEMNYVNVPIMIGYKLKLTSNIAITPKVGGYYAVGYSGDGFAKGETVGTIINPFDGATFPMADSNGDFKEQSILGIENTDFGLKAGLEVNVQNFAIKFAYSWGINELANTYDTGTYTRAFSFTAGYYIFHK